MNIFYRFKHTSPPTVSMIKDAAKFYYTQLRINKGIYYNELIISDINKDLIFTEGYVKTDKKPTRNSSLYLFLSPISPTGITTNTLEVLAHEMVHIKQAVFNEITHADGVIFWHNQIVDSTLTYMNTPWEKEAYRDQKVLYNKFIRYRLDFANNSY